MIRLRVIAADNTPPSHRVIAADTLQRMMILESVTTVTNGLCVYKLNDVHKTHFDSIMYRHVARLSSTDASDSEFDVSALC